MSKITKIQHMADRQRYWIYVDGDYCTSVRERTFPALNLTVGQEVTCDDIKELETHHWKHTYGAAAWQKEKVRLDKVKALIEQMDPRVETKIVGFGADSEEFIEGHPSEAGKPDLEVCTRQESILVMLVEVTGTERMRGTTYWVRPDKLNYARNHPDEDVWLILHFAQPHEKFVFIKPDNGCDYPVAEHV